MDKEEYIKAIEELNQDLKQLYSLPYYKKHRDKILIRKLIKTGRYKLAFRTKLNYLKTKLNRFLIKKENKRISETTYNETNKKIAGKKVLYTCILNNYDSLYTPLLETENTSYIVFSDNKDITKNLKCWKYKAIPLYIKKKCNNNPILINRYIKMHPHELFKEYDLALYVDGSMRVISDISSLFTKINDKTGLAMHLHPKREDIYEEAKACIRQSLGNKKNIKKLIQKYKQEGFPHNYGLFEAGIIAIDLKNKNSKNILNYWYQHFIESETGRDQLSLTYILWKLNYKASDMGVLGSNLNDNHKFRRNIHNYNTKITRYKK